MKTLKMCKNNKKKQTRMSRRLFLGVILCCAVLFSCAKNISVKEVPVTKEKEFGGVYIKKTIDEFNALGFKYGDSVDIIFSNGYEMLDVPYYSGYYSKIGEPILVAYPGYDYIDACIDDGDSLWESSKLNEGDVATITLRERGKYLKNEKLLNIKYTDERNDYESDEVFANFRNVKVGNLKENILYRGASPVDNKHMRAKYANDFIEKVGIKYDIDLSDDNENIIKHLEKDDFKSEYFKRLYDKGKVSISPQSMDFKSDEFAKNIVKAMTDMANNEGPYYIHCVEGKDRTGILLIIIEGLAGANYDEMVSDYMKSFENYYGITKENNLEKYNALKTNGIDSVLEYIANRDEWAGNGTIAFDELDWVNIFGRYLQDYGMSDEDIEKWYDKLVSEEYNE